MLHPHNIRLGKAVMRPANTIPYVKVNCGKINQDAELVEEM